MDYGENKLRFRGNIEVESHLKGNISRYGKHILTAKKHMGGKIIFGEHYLRRQFWKKNHFIWRGAYFCNHRCLNKDFQGFLKHLSCEWFSRTASFRDVDWLKIKSQGMIFHLFMSLFVLVCFELFWLCLFFFGCCFCLLALPVPLFVCLTLCPRQEAARTVHQWQSYRFCIFMMIQRDVIDKIWYDMISLADWLQTVSISEMNGQYGTPPISNWKSVARHAKKWKTFGKLISWSTVCQCLPCDTRKT